MRRYMLIDREQLTIVVNQFDPQFEATLWMQTRRGK